MYIFITLQKKNHGDLDQRFGEGFYLIRYETKGASGLRFVGGVGLRAPESLKRIPKVQSLRCYGCTT